jgi:L-asparaginase
MKLARHEQMQDKQRKPKILVLALGGTIAMTPGAGAGVSPTLSGEMLVAAVPELSTLATIEARSFRQLPGAHLRFEDLEALADAIRQAVKEGVDGVVVTQGTDTIEESSFALDQLLDVDAPVVVTGAMRNPTAPGAEGPANLLAGVRVAMSDAARGLGCIVVMNDQVHAARFVRKMHTSNPGAFQSPNAGPIGWIVEDRVRIVTGVPRVQRLPPGQERSAARVALATIGLGDDGAAVQALCRAGFDGLVVEATGGGHVSPGVADALEQAARAMPVILASRVPAGEVLSRTYGFQGGEIDLQRRGLLRAGSLDALKARVLLTLLLRRGIGDSARIAAALTPWGGA